MGLAFPFEFDTSETVTTIVRGTIAILLVIVAGILYSIVVSRNFRSAAVLFLAGAILVYAARGFRILRASIGTIDSDTVTVRPIRVYGIRLAGPEGTFPVRQFAGIRVERMPPPSEGSGGPHTRVYLVGKEATPEILIARADLDDGRALGRELAAALNLPFEEVSRPY